MRLVLPGQWAPINFHGLYMEWTLLILALCMACTIILAFIGVNPDLIGLSPMIQRQHTREAAIHKRNSPPDHLIIVPESNPIQSEPLNFRAIQ